jgi:hypothetical protein
VFALAAMVAAVAGQFFAVSHEAAVRHFRCAEHGELTHVASVAIDGSQVAPSQRPSAVSSQNALVGDGHEHCAVAFTVRDGAPAPVVRAVAHYAPPPSVVRVIHTAIRQPGRAFVLASAPKTSPPSA